MRIINNLGNIAQVIEFINMYQKSTIKELGKTDKEKVTFNIKEYFNN